MLLAANVTEEHRIDKSEQPAIMGVHRDHGMQVQTALLAIVAQGRGILDRQDVPPLDQPSGARAGSRDHLVRPHTRVAQEAGNAHLAGAIASHATHADAGLPDTDQTGQQAGPPFSRRRSPNRPKLPSISVLPNVAGHHRFREWNAPQEGLEMCAYRRVKPGQAGRRWAESAV
jgi:hypothetical protein